MSHTLISLQTQKKTSHNSTPVTSNYQTYAPCTHSFQALWPRFSNYQCIIRNIQSHEAAWFLSPNAALSCAVPFLTLLMDWIFPFRQPSVTLLLRPNKYLLATSASVSEFHPSPCPKHPPEKDDLSSSDRILISNVPNDCLSRAMGLSSEHLGHCKDANTAAWPRGCFRPRVLFIQPALWYTQTQRRGHVGVHLKETGLMVTGDWGRTEPEPVHAGEAWKSMGSPSS